MNTIAKAKYQIRAKGFTLIELIIVLALISILALLMIPKLVNYVATSSQNIANTNARTCYTEALSTLVDNGDLVKDINLDDKCKLYVGQNDVTEDLQNGVVPDGAEWTNEQGVLGVFRLHSDMESADNSKN